jgi:hypothetical protein
MREEGEEEAMEIKIELFLDREAKNTIRYMEATNPPKFYQGVIYIQKSAFGRDQNYPREIEVTITPKVKLGVVRA